MKIVVSNPRHGSTHISKYYDEINKKDHKVFEFESFNEFLLDPPEWRKEYCIKHIGDLSIKEKVSFIENKRKEGIQVLYKIHAFHLFQNEWLYDWFKDFYRNDEVIVLKRKNLFRALLSVIVHYQGRGPWQKYSEKDETKFLDKCKNINFYYEEMLFDHFFYHKECLEKVEGKILYMEDFNIESNHMPWKVDYEDLFSDIELEKIKNEFDVRCI
tara:strand:- start:43 stop:684 length:642 start_codon:yes stop_codon:yes gene_type:complete